MKTYHTLLSLSSTFAGVRQKGEHVAHLVAQQMQLETMIPAHRSLFVLAKSIKHLVEFPSHVVACLSNVVSGNYRYICL